MRDVHACDSSRRDSCQSRRAVRARQDLHQGALAHLRRAEHDHDPRVIQGFEDTRPEMALNDAHPMPPRSVRQIRRACIGQSAGYTLADLQSIGLQLLDDSTAAVNSALQRARERIDREHADGTIARAHTPTSSRTEAAVIEAFLDAWADVDIPRIIRRWTCASAPTGTTPARTTPTG